VWIIVVPATEDHTYLYGEQRAGTALVFVDRPAGHLDADTSRLGHVGRRRCAVGHLLGHGTDALPSSVIFRPSSLPVSDCGATRRHWRAQEFRGRGT